MFLHNRGGIYRNRLTRGTAHAPLPFVPPTATPPGVFEPKTRSRLDIYNSQFFNARRWFCIYFLCKYSRRWLSYARGAGGSPQEGWREALAVPGDEAVQALRPRRVGRRRLQVGIAVVCGYTRETSR